ncbi:PREDICTED: slit homolog 3 protein-like [Branchiostoma belcheri]|uniref:Slit homolog 3 protein-like n=1 Tax=Branchiostoma belcheri TaxID=7741 RepID=A0A6P4XZ47_BRABE|nr:PREDICTED: slit homolog 3 protein-like [Branchiostoma belcheri]
MMFKKPAGVLMFLLVVLKGTAEAACSCTASACRCHSLGLTSVPQDLPTNITRLYLGWNQITTISRSDFSRYRSLEILGLNDNRISTINSQAFYHLSNLTQLWLVRNRLTTLRSDIFVGLENLVLLILWSNPISDIQAGTFNPTPKLQHLNLQALDLQINMFKTIPTLHYWLPELTTLYLSTNQITDIPRDAFSKQPKLNLLRLSSNQISTLPFGAYDMLSAISTVSIYNNPWQCDCRMVDFRLKMTGSHSFENQITCYQPNSLNGQRLIDINPDDLMTDCQKPNITRFERIGKYPLFQGETLRLVCEASGIPAPEITIILPSGQNATVGSSGRVTVLANGTVTVRNVTDDDYGRYVCMATNSVGSTFAVFSVDVNYSFPKVTLYLIAVVVCTLVIVAIAAYCM